MALYYSGYRPIFKGDNEKRWINTYTGRVGVYSNWSMMSDVDPWDGKFANHTMGTGYSPHGVFLSRKYLGLVVDTPPMPSSSVGAGARLTGFRFTPTLNRSVPGGMAFVSSFGHAAKRGVPYQFFDNYTFHGVTSAQTIISAGHSARYPGTTGAPATFGAFAPWVWKGAASTQAMPSTLGQAGTASVLGHNKVNEWKGVTSAKALNV